MALIVAMAAASCSNESTPSAGTTETAAMGATAEPVPPAGTSAGPAEETTVITTTIPSSPVTSYATPTQGPPSSPSSTTATAASGASAGLRPVGLAGVNDPDCTSQARPVVLLHGTLSTVAGNFRALVPALLAAGRCVYGIDYGLGGTRPVADSARSVSLFIDAVLAATGAEQVDVVAYSQGGLVLRTALRQDDVAAKVAIAVLIAPSFHGTTSSLLDALPAGACPGCSDQVAGSPLLTELNAGGDLDGEVRYAVVSTQDDIVVTPVGAQVPVGPPDRVRSLLVQDRCPDSRVDHVALPADAGVIAWTVAALQNDGVPDPSALTCG